MKTNTVKQRLALYKKALVDYLRENKKIKVSQSTFVEHGLCYYFYKRHSGVQILNKDIAQLMPELGKGYRKLETGYWFKHRGPTIHRIKALEKAIQRCEEQLKAK